MGWARHSERERKREEARSDQREKEMGSLISGVGVGHGRRGLKRGGGRLAFSSNPVVHRGLLV